MDALVAFLTTVPAFARVRVGRDPERGATATEYALLAALIAGVIIVGVVAVGDQALALFEHNAAEVNRI